MLEPPAGEEAEIRRREALVNLDDLVGQRGTAATQLTPGGKGRFGEMLVDVMAAGEVIDRGAKIEVVTVQGNHVLVKEVEEGIGEGGESRVKGEWGACGPIRGRLRFRGRGSNCGLRSRMNPLSWIDDELAELDRASLRRRLAAREGPQSARLVIDGRELINFGSNDYLGLAADPRLGQAVAECVEREGWGSGASPLITGLASVHQRLQERAGRVRRHRGGPAVHLGLCRQRGHDRRAGGTRRRGLLRPQEPRQSAGWLPAVAGRRSRLSPRRLSSPGGAAGRVAASTGGG